VIWDLVSSKRYLIKRRLTPYLFIAFPLLAVVFLVAFPVLYALYISFFDWTLLASERPFVGLKNYVDILGENRFHVTLYNTFYYVVVYVFWVTFLGLVMALIANSLRESLKTYVRTITFIPVVTSMVAVSVIWIWLYQPSFGLINHLLGYFGLGPYSWLQDPKLAMKSVIVMTLWKSVGFTMIIYVAGLVNIPMEYYEAAMVDGASQWHRIWYITLPLLKSVTLFQVVTGIISAFQVFTQTYVMTKGGPGTATTTVVLEIYYRGFQFLRMGEASALAFILFAIILVLTILQLKYFRADVTY
jgi:multiple sugar transport system permease protein